VSVSISTAEHDMVPPEIVSTVFYSATVSDSLAILVAETIGGTQLLTWGNEGAVQLLGYGLEDLRATPVRHLFPTLGGGELKLLLRRERVARMTLPVRTASGADVEAVVITTPSPGGRMWTVRMLATANEQERVLRATADAHERRFSALTERSPVPTLLSEQGMRLAHVNDAFCSLVGLRA
jgi:PAS domain-containing protein